MEFLIIAIFMAIFLIWGWVNRQTRHGSITVRINMDTEEYQKKIEEMKSAWEKLYKGPRPHVEIIKVGE